jgi:hypothetical protein
MPEIVGEYVDRLCTVEMRPAAGNLPRGAIHRLYQAARTWRGRPLTLASAEALRLAVPAGAPVFLVTGAGGPPVLPNAEVDGLLGAAVLAKTLHFGLGAEPFILTEERAIEPVRAAVAAAGMRFTRLGEDPAVDHAVTHVSTPLAADECRAQASTLFRNHPPSAVIAIEKLSPNSAGIIHGGTGIDQDAKHSKPQFLFEEAERAGALTVGIGDGGNEVGFGVVADAVREVMPAGARCTCPCGAGNAAAIATTEFVVAAISDWGAYAVAGMLAHLIDRPDLLLSADELERMIRAVVDAGAYDGVFARPVLADDGVPLRAQLAYATMLESLFAVARSNVASPGH